MTNAMGNCSLEAKYQSLIKKCKWDFKFENETEWIEIGVMWCKTYSYLLENSTNW